MQLDLYPALSAWACDFDGHGTNLISFSSRAVKKVSEGFATARNLSKPPPGAARWNYFMLQRSGFVDPEEEPFFAFPRIELDDQSGGNYHDLARVTFSPRRIELDFGATPFLDKYAAIVIHATQLPRGIVEFFVNGLYLGDRVIYSGDFPDAGRVIQTSHQMNLGQ